MRNKAEAIAVLQRLLTESHKTRMARVRQLASKRKKGKVDIKISSFNASCLSNKRASLELALTKQKIDLAIVNEVGCPVPPPVRGYTIYQARDDRPFRGSCMYLKTSLIEHTTKVPDRSDEDDIEMIHLRLNTQPALRVPGL